MTVNELLRFEELTALYLADGERETNGVYIGDLLSWVMGRAQADQIWVTIMSNINVLAVASLTDVACVILADSVTLSDDVLSAAKEKGINVLQSRLPAFETARLLFGEHS